MGFLRRLLFGQAQTSRRITVEPAMGAGEPWWGHQEAVALAAGRGFTFDVVGEAQWQANLSTICGGKREDGHKREVVAQLVLESNPRDPNAVGVMIDAKPVGWIPADRTAEVKAALVRISPAGKAVTCKAKIVGGWDRGEGDEGHFGVKLSVAWPLKVHQDRGGTRNQRGKA